MTKLSAECRQLGTLYLSMKIWYNTENSYGIDKNERHGIKITIPNELPVDYLLYKLEYKRETDCHR